MTEDRKKQRRTFWNGFEAGLVGAALVEALPALFRWLVRSDTW